ncbi:MAG: 1,6-anhydro-N-acetylmuramyl-L-alanine amidase AmpD [Gammaproteobacteria bacterium]|nr:1,6-anhydro-N-acetylmuramyl-L-alanine amidase AmpD [Gammaproteobacteria bacterium]
MTESSGTICSDTRESARRPPLRIEPATGLLAGVRQVLSPHFDARPKDAAPELIVVHGISLPAGEFGGPWIDHLFAGSLRPDAHPSFHDTAALRVSAHAVIRRDGTITQYVPFGLRAWHAGHSQYQGRSGCNDFSIGVELEGSDAIPYTDAQYESLTALVRALLSTYPTLSAERITGHSDIAPGRKTDPGPAFHWQRWRKMLGSK